MFRSAIPLLVRYTLTRREADGMAATIKQLPREMYRPTLSYFDAATMDILLFYQHRMVYPAIGDQLLLLLWSEPGSVIGNLMQSLATSRVLPDNGGSPTERSP